MELHSKGSQFQWISGKNPSDLLGFWQWFSPPNGSWRQETIGDYATQKKILQKFINLEKILEISEKFSIIFDVFRISNGITLKRQSVFNFFNSWQWFSPSWCQVFQWNYTQKCIFSKSHKFLKNLMTSDDKWWWVMMSDDEWWGVMMRDNELWWVMISDGK